MQERDYTNASLRESIMDGINSLENKEAKSLSLNQFEIYQDRLLPFVRKYLESFFNQKTVQEMPLISSINLARRIVKQEARIYVDKPKREFVNVSEEQSMALEKLYRDIGMDAAMLKLNELYKLQNNQIHAYVTISNRKLKVKALMRHQVDAVPKASDPEAADAYVISGFDKFQYNASYQNETEQLGRTLDRTYRDGVNQLTGDGDDYKGGLNRFALWSELQNFVTDADGNILTEDTTNPLGVIPVVEIAQMKDSEYWIRGGSALTDFTIQFNAAYSDLGFVVRMQGFSMAIITAPESVMPQSVQIGPQYILRLPVDPGNPVTPTFSYANPNSDITGSISYIEALLSSFLTSRGLDPRLVNQKGNSVQYSSGLERLLAMIESFAPSKSDYDVFKVAEKELFKVIKAYINTYSGTDLLEYNIGQIPEDADVMVTYAEPQLIQTEAERLANIQTLVELGAMAEVEKIEKARNVSPEKAKEILTMVRSEQV
jgi:hypothetical protein